MKLRVFFLNHFFHFDVPYISLSEAATTDRTETHVE